MTMRMVSEFVRQHRFDLIRRVIVEQCVGQDDAVPERELALEAPMACGVGACLGCTVPRRKGGYARVCTDGPVFQAREIAW